MKFALFLTLLLSAQITSADSEREKRIRKQMMDRVDVLIDKTEALRSDLDREDVVAACIKIKEMFLIYPDHLKSLGSHLDIYRGRSVRAKNSALDELIFLHKQTQYCDQGKDAEYVDPKKLDKKMKRIEKSLKKQKRVIRRTDTGQENSFYYQYEF